MSKKGECQDNFVQEYLQSTKHFFIKKKTMKSGAPASNNAQESLTKMTD